MRVKSSQFKVCSCAATTAMVLAWACSNPAPSATSNALPALDTSELGPAVREQVEQALAAASAGGDDASAPGSLGIVLQAYGFYELAAVAYSRAVDLAPGVFSLALLPRAARLPPTIW